MFSNSLHLLGLVWTSLLSCSPPLQIYLQPERDKQYLHHWTYTFYIDAKATVLHINFRVHPVSRVKLLTTYHISGMVCSQAKVSNLHTVLRVKEDVDRLQVPVNHALK